MYVKSLRKVLGKVCLEKYKCKVVVEVIVSELLLMGGSTQHEKYIKEGTRVL